MIDKIATIFSLILWFGVGLTLLTGFLNKILHYIKKWRLKHE